jgi:hypothetical protein
MSLSKSSYEEQAKAYTRTIRKFSPNAGAEVEKIHTTYGPHAAYCASLAVILVKSKLERFGVVPDRASYVEFIHHYPHALRSLEHALECLVQDYKVGNVRFDRGGTDSQPAAKERQIAE